MNALAQLLSVVSATNERALLDALRHISDTSAGNNKAPHLRLIEALNPALDSSHPSGPPAEDAVPPRAATAPPPIERGPATTQPSSPPNEQRSAGRDDVLPDFSDLRAHLSTPALLEPPTTPALDPDAFRASILETLAATLNSYRTLLDHYSDAFDRAVPAATTEGKGQLETLLVNARRVLIKYPIAGAAGYRALMAEGRKFADTPEGREIQEMLTRSPVFLKARTLFEGMSGGMLRDEPSMLPSVILDAGMAELAHSEIERLLERLATMQPGK